MKKKKTQEEYLFTREKAHKRNCARERAHVRFTRRRLKVINHVGNHVERTKVRE